MILTAIPLTIVIIDQLSKHLCVNALSPGQSIPVISNVFHLTLVLNKGAAFGILKNQTLFFIVISVTAILAIIYYLGKSRDGALFPNLPLLLILGGAVSNLIDRVRLGCVIDFLDFRVWPVFNVADSAITVGAILFVIDTVRKNREKVGTAPTFSK